MLRIMLSVGAVSALSLGAWAFDKGVTVDGHRGALLHRVSEMSTSCDRFEGKVVSERGDRKAMKTTAKADTKRREPLPAERLGIMLRVSTL